MTPRRPDLASPSDRATGRDRAGPEAPRRDPVTPLIIVLGPLVTWVVVMGLTALVASPEVGPGECSGIGFGCTLPPREVVGFWAVVGGVVAVPVATLVAAVTVRLLPVPARRTGAATVVGIFAVLAVVAGGVVSAAA